MVWWINNYNTRLINRGTHMGFRRLHDRIFPSLNIMFDCHKPLDAHDVYMLSTVGVNIVNVDLTVHDEAYFNTVKTAIIGAEKIPENYPSPYYRPIGLSVAISVNAPVNVDERVDIIILKDVTIAAQLLEFRKQNASLSSMPILFWLSKFEIEDLNELIKISDGVIFDIENMNLENYYDTLQKTKESCKPLFYVEATLADDYYVDTATDLQMLTIASKLVQDRVSGVLVFDKDASKPSPIDALRSFAKATDIAEADVKASKDYFDLSFRVITPILPSRATALSASLAALQCGASAMLVLTTSGVSAKLLSSSSPPCAVLAVTTREKTARRLHLYRKIIPLLYDNTRRGKWQEEVQSRIGFGIRIALEMGVCRAGAKLVVLAQAEETSGFCNSFQIIRLPFTCNE